MAKRKNCVSIAHSFFFRIVLSEREIWCTKDSIRFKLAELIWNVLLDHRGLVSLERSHSSVSPLWEPPSAAGSSPLSSGPVRQPPYPLSVWETCPSSLESPHVSICPITASYLWYVPPFLVSDIPLNTSLCLRRLCHHCCSRCYLGGDVSAKSRWNMLISFQICQQKEKFRWKPLISPLSSPTFASASPMTDSWPSVRETTVSIYL